MPIAISCACGKKFSVAEEHAGKRAKCPSCAGALTIPALPPAPKKQKIEDLLKDALKQGTVPSREETKPRAKKKPAKKRTAAK